MDATNPVCISLLHTKSKRDNAYAAGAQMTISKQALINKESVGDEFEEKMEAIHKLEEVADYLKDALGRGIEF